MKTKTRTGLPAAKTLFDDLVKTHQLQGPDIHANAWFLPYHRYLVSAHERLLREVCGYKGAHPYVHTIRKSLLCILTYKSYWDETRDAGKFSKSIIFDAKYGFGGDGHGPNKCIKDGPFAWYTLNTGPGFENTEHCIWRHINDSRSLGARQENIDRCMPLTKFADANLCFDIGLLPGEEAPPRPDVPPPDFDFRFPENVIHKSLHAGAHTGGLLTVSFRRLAFTNIKQLVGR